MDAGTSFAGAGRDRAGGLALAAVLAATFLVRAVGLDQPIVENYVGRQVPTAMVARNLERGSGLLRPRLDTAPAPNYFLVEPPLYECGVVAVRRATGLGLEAAGAGALGDRDRGRGLGDLRALRRRDGRRAALLAAGAFAAFPLTIRYGRAFQPDAAMLGAVVSGLACWDRSRGLSRSAARRAWFAAGWVLLALGFAIKIIAAPLLILPAFVGLRQRRLSVWLAAGTTLVPALLWYAWAAHLAASGGGSRASADNGAIWLGLLAPSSLLHLESLRLALWFVAVRAFTPVGAALALFGLIGGRRGLGLWRAWGLVALATLAPLASKLHHEYYLLILAPAAAAGVGLALDRMAGVRHGRLMATSAAAGLLILAAVQARFDLADAARVGRPGGGRAGRGGIHPVRCLGGRAGGAAVRIRPPRLPAGVDRHGRAAGGRRVGHRGRRRGPRPDRPGGLLPESRGPILRRPRRSPRGPAPTGLARRGPPTIQGHYRPARGPHRRPGIGPILRDAPACQLMSGRSRSPTSPHGRRSGGGSAC